MGTEKNRGNFTTSMGFILAAAGSAVGLGNIWKFPYLAGSSGGGIFLLVYAALILLVGIPLLIAETSVGRYGQVDAYGSFAKIADEAGSKRPGLWGIFGFSGILCVFIIHTYYIVIGGWVAGYVVKTAFSPLSELNEGYFGAFISSPVEPLIFTMLFGLACLLIVLGGVQSGIERSSKSLFKNRRNAVSGHLFPLGLR